MNLRLSGEVPAGGPASMRCLITSVSRNPWDKRHKGYETVGVSTGKSRTRQSLLRSKWRARDLADQVRMPG